MFNSLHGRITGREEQKVYLDTHGIEWEILAPAPTVRLLPPDGSDATLYTWLQHTDALMCLYGFASRQDFASHPYQLLLAAGIIAQRVKALG